MIKFLILLSVVYSINAVNFNCLKGPSYWCSSLENAKECNRVVECYAKNIVKPTKPPVDEHCTTCETIVSTIEKELPRITLKEFLKLVNVELCDHLKPELNKICKEFFVKYGPKIYQTFKQEASPKHVCRMLQLCKGNSDSFVVKFIKENNVGSSGVCDVCKEVFKKLKELFSLIDEKTFTSFIKTVVCNSLPGPLKDTCSELMSTFADRIYKFIVNILDGDRTCSELHLCTTNKMGSNWQCSTCIDVITVLKKDLKGVSSSEIEAFVDDKACSQVPSIVQGFCKEYVSKLVPVFIAQIQSSATPQQICVQNKVCSIHDKRQKLLKTKVGSLECSLCEKVFGKLVSMLINEEVIEKLKNFTEQNICPRFGNEKAECKKFVEQYLEKYLKMILSEFTGKKICDLLGLCSSMNNNKSIKLGGATECDLCKFILTDAKKLIADETVQQKIKDFLKNEVCKLFKSDAAKCRQYVDESYTIIINTIISEMNVDKLCHFTGFCATYFKNNVLGVIPTEKIQVASVKCDICETTLAELIKVATSNKMQVSLINLLESKVCPHMGIVKSECKEAVDNYLPYLFQIARMSLNSKLLCTELHLCDSPELKRISKKLEQKQKSGSSVCEVCKFLVNETKTLLSNADIQTDLKNLIEKLVCPLFHNKSAECKQDIDEYFSFAINILVDFLKPSLCSDIDLCKSKIDYKKMVLLTKSEDVKTVCDMCSNLYQYLKHIPNEKSPAEILLGINVICNKYSSNVRLSCLNQIMRLPILSTLLKSAKNEAEFCQKSTLCQQDVTPFRLGENPCTRGPAHWCKSKENAKRCGSGAVKYCTDKVWSLKQFN